MNLLGCFPYNRTVSAGCQLKFTLLKHGVSRQRNQAPDIFAIPWQRNCKCYFTLVCRCLLSYHNSLFLAESMTINTEASSSAQCAPWSCWIYTTWTMWLQGAIYNELDNGESSTMANHLSSYCRISRNLDKTLFII